MSSLTSSGTQTSTPLTALTISLNPTKLITTKWSTRTLVIFSTVLIVQAGPPTAYAALNWVRPPGTMSLPFLVWHSGRSTMASRGMLTPYARSRSAERCSRIVVSERPGVSPPMLVPSRLSEPITSTLSGFFGPSTSTASGRSSPRASAIETALMLPSSFL